MYKGIIPRIPFKLVTQFETITYMIGINHYTKYTSLLGLCCMLTQWFSGSLIN